MLWRYHDQGRQGQRAHSPKMQQRQGSWPLWGSTDPALIEVPDQLHNGYLYHQHGCKILHLPSLGISPGRAGEGEEEKYLQSCLKQCHHFFPFVVSADSMLGYEASMVLK
eukprot:3262665-Ditylum_brightwellii.AAC.1